MSKCSDFLSVGAHLWFCECPDMQLRWKELGKNFSDDFKEFTWQQLGCISPRTKIEIDNNVIFINQQGELKNG